MSRVSRGSSSSTGVMHRPQLNGYWVKFKKCNCEPTKYFDIKVSGSRNNPGRPFYKCFSCGEFDWVYEQDMMKVDGVDEEEATYTKVDAELNCVKERVESMARSAAFLVKIAGLMYLVLVICVMFK